MQRLLAEAEELSPDSIEFAKDIDYATAGSRLAPVVERAMDENPAAFNRLRGVVQERLDELGDVGQERGLVTLAADFATTERLKRDQLSGDERQQLRSLWEELLSR